jgi:hypothetical protein
LPVLIAKIPSKPSTTEISNPIHLFSAAVATTKTTITTTTAFFNAAEDNQQFSTAAE